LHYQDWISALPWGGLPLHTRPKQPPIFKKVGDVKVRPRGGVKTTQMYIINNNFLYIFLKIKSNSTKPKEKKCGS
jgi:hypothetical protein